MTTARLVPAHPRLLILAPFAPRLDTPHGGGRVLARFLLEISQRHTVRLLYMQGSDEPPIDPLIQERCELTYKVTRSWTGRSLFKRIIRHLRLASAPIHGIPMWVADWESRQFLELARSVVSSWQPDLVEFEFSIMGQYIYALRGCSAPRILVEYEAAERAGPFLQIGPAFLRTAAYHYDRSAWKNFEPAIIRQVQAVVAFTPKDQEALAHYELCTPIYMIPFGTDISNHSFNPTGNEPPSLLFIGNFIHPPNREAAIRLVRDIYPAVHKKHPSLTCAIVGPNPPQKLKHLAREGVTVTGWVPDMAPYFDRAAIFVAPLRMGGGMRVKMLEAMAAGKAIVATPLAKEGLNIQDGEQMLLAESDEEMIARIDQLLADPSKRAQLATNARTWAQANLSWDKTILEYEHLYQILLSKGTQ